MTAITVLPPAGDGWFKSSFSQGNGACVEIRFEEGLAHVRNTRNRSGPTVAFNRAEWEAFLLGAWHGEFDMPA
ncbi:DUF397 domain-containing protein [Streptomyces antimycoticus]|uniref:DUF397 domain-containing protein n=3 Tax=Streptomyces TaxID=1883 RepID=A0ABD5JHX7_9ACTN|nr:MULTISPECIES: DUF397 domain-containing protein [Streptomyces]KUL47836.1 hypothetical protein ADL28_31155 [Streptomyces violaceusniger]MEE4588022.1 DUF397 domain-containing protein [Streptomyces sp. DSM 41602]RSS32707.1 DUF397 domain-containing protein [Streptomyces sp. WAC05858]WJD94607.1 DUF397 domain-containing protein [Streptomyces antimycoticus]